MIVGPSANVSDTVNHNETKLIMPISGELWVLLKAFLWFGIPLAIGGYELYRVRKLRKEE